MLIIMSWAALSMRMSSKNNNYDYVLGVAPSQ